MKWTAVVLCVLVVLPLMAQGGNIGKVDPKEDYDYDEKKTKDEDAPGGEDAGPEMGGLSEHVGPDVEDEGPLRFRGAGPMGHQLFDIPGNMTEAEWKKKQYEHFQKLKYNEWQKKQFEEFEKQRFLQWQMQRWQESQARRAHKVQMEHQQFMNKAGQEMQAEQQKHHEWLQNLLNNPDDRAALMKDIQDEDEKEREL